MGTVYANTKIFHFSEQLAAVANDRVVAPIHIRLKPTNRCNHRCHYCCYRNSDLFLSQLMNDADQIPQETMVQLVKDFKQMGVKAVTFSGGGEPLCYPYIADTIDGLAAAGIKIAMLSNGGMLRGDIAEKLARQAVWLRISMDAADPEGYAASRGVSRTEFEKVCSNIKNFASIKGRTCVLGLNLIVTRNNSHQILEFLKLTKELGVDHVKVSGVVVSTTPSANDAYHAPIYSLVRQQLDEALSSLVDTNFAIIDLLHEPKSKTDMFEKDYDWCPMSRFLIVIGADQQVYTCQDKAYTTSGLLGSLKGTDFFHLWHSSETVKRLKTLSPSRDCRHHCVAHTKNLMLLDYFRADRGHLEFV